MSPFDGADVTSWRECGRDFKRNVNVILRVISSKQMTAKRVDFSGDCRHDYLLNGTYENRRAEFHRPYRMEIRLCVRGHFFVCVSWPREGEF